MAEKATENMREIAEKRRMGGREMDALMRVIGIASEWEYTVINCEKRLRSVANGWRDAKMLQSVSLSLTKKLLATLPADQMARFKKNMDNIRVNVTVKQGPVAAKPDEYWYFHKDDVAILIRSALQYDCAGCDKCGKDIKNCDIRKALNGVLTHDFPKSDGCEFRDLVFRENIPFLKPKYNE